jgi:hypothetical protein
MNVKYLETLSSMGRCSSVGIATRYGLDGPGIEFRWGEVFRIRPDWLWGPHILLYNEYRFFPGGKADGAWRWPPTPSSAEVEERVNLYLYSPFGRSWPVLGCLFPLPLPNILHFGNSNIMDHSPHAEDTFIQPSYSFRNQRMLDVVPTSKRETTCVVFYRCDAESDIHWRDVTTKPTVCHRVL